VIRAKAVSGADGARLTVEWRAHASVVTAERIRVISVNGHGRDE
jgi:hypothetical protein